MLGLLLEIETDEPRELNVRRRCRLPRADRPRATKKAWRYALRAIDLYCDKSSIFPTKTEKAAVGWEGAGAPCDLVKGAPSVDFPWVTVTDQAELARLQAEGKAPPDEQIDGGCEKLAFAGRLDEDGHWQGWVLRQYLTGNVYGQPGGNCHVIELGVSIIEF